jgi:prepilin-type N-terminal cleavage/methylation domain-containing protein
VFLGIHKRLHRDDSGFTLVELMMALFVLSIVMTSVAYTATIAFKHAGIARQRETGSGYAMKYYQEALALPFNAIKLGLNPTLDSTYAGDTNIITNSTTCATTGASQPCVKVPGVTACGASTCYESLVVTPGASGNSCSPQTPPLCQHQWQETPTSGSSGAGTTYTSRAYVTTPPSTTCKSCYRVMVQSSWSSPLSTGAASTITYQSLMTNTSGGCLQTGSHPYSGPCGPYIYGQALIPQGSITIKANTTGGTSIQNINLGSAVISLPEDASNSQTSQISLVQGLANTSGVSLGLGTATPTTVGNNYLAVQADNDATLSGATSQSKDLSTVPDNSGNVSAIAGASSTGTTSASTCGSTVVNAICLSKANTDSPTSAMAAVAASASPSCNSVVNALPCGYSVSLVRSGASCPGTMSTCVVLHLYNGATDLGTCTLVSVGAPTTSSTTQVSQNTSAIPLPQTAKVSRTLGQVTVGCIPSLVATPPTSWNLIPTGFTSVNTTNSGFLAAIKTGYMQTLQSQAGVASPTTSATVSGTEWYYSPGSSTVAGATLAALLPGTSNSLSTAGTLNASVANSVATWSSGGTLPSKLATTVNTWSAGGTLPSALASTTASWISYGTSNNIANASTTSFKVTESPAPPAVPFVILIGTEQMNVTARDTTSGGCSSTIPCYTVARGYNGTTAVSHSNGSAVSYQIPGCPSTCSFNVTETSAPPSSTPFVIQIDSEQMNVTSRTPVSGSTYTYAVTRAYNSTTAALHAAGTSFSYQIPGCPTSCNFDVSESAAPPSSTPFTIQIDGEQMLVTARAKYNPTGAPSGCINSNSLWCYTVTRGYNSTTATSHAANATVSYVIGGCPSPCSFNVTETMSPPATPFTILVDSEQMNVTSRTPVSGSTYTYVATRAYNSTTAASHASGTTVYYPSVPFGYTTLTDSSATGASITPTSVNYTTGGCTYQESVTGLSSPSGSVTNTTTAGIVTNSSGSLTAPLAADFKFNVTCGATVVADLDILLNLGTLKTTATYSAGAS